MRRWFMLGLGMAAQAAGTVFLFGLPFLLPELRAETGLPLGRLGLLVGCPGAGMLLALIAWGAAADRYGERLVMALGLAGSAGCLTVAAFWHRPVPLGVLLVLAGVAGASVNAASGRLVLGWFPPQRRGIAMGWRQTALPLRIAVAGGLRPAGSVRGSWPAGWRGWAGGRTSTPSPSGCWGAGSRGPRAPARYCCWSPRSLRSAVRGWPSPPWPNSPARPGPAAPSARTTPCRTSPPPVPRRSGGC